MKPAVVTLCATSILLLTGCMSLQVDLAQIQKPRPAPELAPLGDFVGSWNWEAERVGPGGKVEKWTGTAKWDWVLGGTYLHGDLTTKGPAHSFASSGYWGWHPQKRTYVWWMLNDWGYPQEGTAKYDDAKKLWTMDYQGLGLDGTTSYGRYAMQVKDKNTLEWTMVEGVDLLRNIKKIEMKGSYKRK